MSNYIKQIYILSAVLLVLFTNCGIETYTYLAPPTPGNSDNSSYVSFVNNNVNTDVFKGFELYYRMFTDYQTWDDFIGAFTDKDNPSLTYLSSNGYRRIYTFEDANTSNPDEFDYYDALPLIYIINPADRTNDFTITLNFGLMNSYTASDGELFYPYAEPDPDSILISNSYLYTGTTSPLLYFGRYINNNEIKSFAQNDLDESDDGDVPATTSNQTYLSIFALSYGLEDFTTKIYSEPVSLGYVILNTID